MSTTGKLLEITPEHHEFQKVLTLDLDFDPPWNDEQWRELNLNHHSFFIWNVSGSVQGFALFVTLPGEETSHLLKIYLQPHLRGTSHSTSFWLHICEKLKEKSFNEVYLEVKSQNFAAVKFYQKLGFKTLRLVKGYYSDGSDGLMMNLTI